MITQLPALSASPQMIQFSFRAFVLWKTAALLRYLLGCKRAKFIRIHSEAKRLHSDDLAVKVSAEEDL